MEAKTLKEFIAFARANPDRLSYGSAGNGSVNHLLGEMLKSEAEIRVVHVLDSHSRRSDAKDYIW